MVVTHIYFLMFTPEVWERWTHFDECFSKGVGSTTNYIAVKCPLEKEKHSKIPKHQFFGEFQPLVGDVVVEGMNVRWRKKAGGGWGCYTSPLKGGLKWWCFVYLLFCDLYIRGTWHLAKPCGKKSYSNRRWVKDPVRMKNDREKSGNSWEYPRCQHVPPICGIVVV